MKRRAAVGWGLGIVVALWLAGAVSPQAAEPPPEATITELMQAMVIPASSNLFDVPRCVPVFTLFNVAVRYSAGGRRVSASIVSIG